MKTGDIVQVYDHPVTFEGFEGEAKLISEYRPNEGDGLSMWVVEFLDDPGQEYLRAVYEQEPLTAN